MKIPTTTTVQDWNHLIELFDVDSEFHFDRITDIPAILSWWRAKHGRNALCVRTLAEVARQLGYLAE